nr:MAG TPA: hypothetical protein [Caudoviricetes sp.]DAT91325.1 MAG TPA: hypothetical protein [Caudoviricetes sp.]
MHNIYNSFLQLKAIEKTADNLLKYYKIIDISILVFQLNVDAIILYYKCKLIK